MVEFCFSIRSHDRLALLLETSLSIACRVHREGFEFQTIEMDGDLPVLEMNIDANEEVNICERNYLCGIHKIFPYV
jgi:hypothetical protein